MADVITTAQYVLRTKQRGMVFRKLAFDGLNRIRRGAHVLGAQVLFRTVYSEHPEGSYKRTYNLFNAFETNVSQKIDGAVLTLYINPSEDIQSYSGEGIYQYYPSYVLQGNFFGRQSTTRPFTVNWREEVGAYVLKELTTLLSRNLRRVL